MSILIPLLPTMFLAGLLFESYKSYRTESMVEWQFGWWEPRHSVSFVSTVICWTMYLTVLTCGSSS